MIINWGPLLIVFGVGLSSAVTVVLLVTLALLGLSARAGRATQPPARCPMFTQGTGDALTAACLTGATVIVVFGLRVIVTRRST
jgi:hypothetical protein